MVIPASVLSNGDGGTRGGGYICPTPTEHHCPVYIYLIYTGAIYGGVMAAGSTGDKAVMVSGRSIPRPRGREDGGAGYGYG